MVKQRFLQVAFMKSKRIERLLVRDSLFDKRRQLVPVAYQYPSARTRQWNKGLGWCSLRRLVHDTEVKFQLLDTANTGDADTGSGDKLIRREQCGMEVAPTAEPAGPIEMHVK